MEPRDLEDLLEELFAEIQPAPSPDKDEESGGESTSEGKGPGDEGRGQWEQGPIRISVDAEDRVNFAMHHNRIPVVRRLTVENVGDETLEMVEIKLRLDAGNLEEDEFADTETL